MEMIIKDSLEITTDCTCANEDGTWTECFGCWNDSKELFSELFSTWVKANADATNTIRIDGKNMTWQRLDGYAVVEADADAVLDKMGLRGDYTLRFMLDGTSLTATRWSHDEPTGCGFTFTFVADED